jgi:GDP-mannose 6-dehydrogenase
MTRIAVFGLGYVGVVTASILADDGHHVVGVEPNLTKVDLVNAGRSPIVEAGVDDLVARGTAAGRLRATSDPEEAVHDSDVTLICVGTPSNPNGSLDLSQIQKVCHQIGAVLADSPAGHVVVVRSTMLPGSTREVVIPALEQASGRTAGDGFHVCVNPEFLREGSAVRDFHEPPFTLIGADEVGAAELLTSLYETVPAERIVAPIEVAEMIKYGSNAFHALKVVFANEMGSICKRQGLDGREIMSILCSDTTLNISSAYLTPGFAFGGSCLPKDLRALVHHARRFDVDVPVLGSILESNRQHVERALRMVKDSGHKRVGVLGFSFKAGTDDLRESPNVELIERLIGKGYQLRIFDRNVSLARLQGANRAFIEREIPHISALMSDTMDEVIDLSDVIVIGNRDPAFAGALERVHADQTVIDLVGLRLEGPNDDGPRYEGICW